MTDHEKNLIAVICPAIQSKQLIRFWYLNSTNGIRDWRTVEPHIIGCFPRKHIQLSAWYLPTKEQGMVGHTENWRTYLLKNISDIQILDQKFELVRPDFDSTGGGMKEIFCVINKDRQAFMKINP